MTQKSPSYPPKPHVSVPLGVCDLLTRISADLSDVFSDMSEVTSHKAAVILAVERTPSLVPVSSGGILGILAALDEQRLRSYQVKGQLKQEISSQFLFSVTAGKIPAGRLVPFGRRLAQEAGQVSSGRFRGRRGRRQLFVSFTLWRG